MFLKLTQRNAGQKQAKSLLSKAKSRRINERYYVFLWVMQRSIFFPDTTKIDTKKWTKIWTKTSVFWTPVHRKKILLKMVIIDPHTFWYISLLKISHWFFIINSHLFGSDVKQEDGAISSDPDRPPTVVIRSRFLHLSTCQFFRPFPPI